MSEHTWASTKLERLAKLLEFSEENKVLWDSGELAVILRHQLDSPIVRDLGTLPRAAAERLKRAVSARGLLLQSFAALFFPPDPPLELLVLTKQFSKAHHNNPDMGLPAEIALMLYYASIAVALLRHHERISKLDDAHMLEGLTWARDQTWVDLRMKQLFQDALTELGK